MSVRSRGSVPVRLALVAMVVVGVLAGCSRSSVGAGAEAPTTEARTVPSFDRIVVANSITVHARIGSSSSVSVTAEPSVLPHVVTSVADGRLTIAIDRTSQQMHVVHVEVTAPSVAAIDATTAASVLAEGLSGDALEVSADSNASVTATGAISRLVVVAATASTLKLVGLPVRTAQVDIGTASNVEISAADAVHGSVHESASLTIAGAASVDVTETTSGRVVRAS